MPPQFLEFRVGRGIRSEADRDKKREDESRNNGSAEIACKEHERIFYNIHRSEENYRRKDEKEDSRKRERAELFFPDEIRTPHIRCLHERAYACDDDEAEPETRVAMEKIVGARAERERRKRERPSYAK